MKLSNPFGFTRGPVTVITTATYVALISVLIVIQTGVPSPPSSPVRVHGLNLTEAWQDLQLLTASYHPYNSRNNDHVHDWLLLRIQSILLENNASASTAYVFDDTTSNLTFSSQGSIASAGGVSVYFEGTNILVLVPGSDDDNTEWWKDPKGFGATDDGVGVISILQLLKYYTTSGNTPKNGLVLLLNNGEEDFLNGANVFSQHPLSRYVNTFLNLEGAGAGGRAALFRSTDAQVTKAYAKSKYPFGTVISGDAFNRGLIRSQTDYVVFNGILGYRGLDVAFIEPRARYHTNQDDSRHTGRQAIWHMLSAALATTKELTSQGLSPESNKSATPAVWFDLFGRAFAVLQTHTFFALSVALLVAGPILLFLTLVLLSRADKFYFLSGSRQFRSRDGHDAVPLYGWRGFFRFPIILLLACAAPVALAYLVFKQNAFIAHSSEWAAWSLFISSFLFVAWFCSRVADFGRPSSLTRAYGFSWLCLGWWAILVADTVSEEQFHIVGGYFSLFYSATLFVVTWISYLELFSLPPKDKYCHGKLPDDLPSSRSTSQSRPRTAQREEDDDEEEATERSGLLRNPGTSRYNNYTRAEEDDPEETTDKADEKHTHEEQEWSKSQWTWLWLVQFILVAPINVVLLGQIGLYMVSALHQTGPDGSSMFLVYISMAILTIFIFSPLVPFLHRFTWHIPMFLFLVLIGTLVYNLIAFPFSSQNRLKLFFQQTLDLDNGTNTVSLWGVDPYVQDTIPAFPSAAGQDLDCMTLAERKRCSWSGPAPRVGNVHSNFAPETQYKSWVTFNVSRLANSSDTKSARFNIYGKNTRSCRLRFDSPISNFHVRGQSPVDSRFKPVPEGGSKEIRLWSRTWNRSWTVDVTWDKGFERNATMEGYVACIWSDANQKGVIPAFDEATHYAPDWVAITKASDGLVEGFKRFKI